MKPGHLVRLFLYLAAFAAAGYLASSLYRLVDTGPAAASVPSSHDLGIVQQNTKVSAQIPFVNDKTQTLTIENVSTSCGCTVVEPETKVIGAGETIMLPVVFSSGTRPGPVSSEVHVALSDGTMRNLVIIAYVVGGNAGLVDFGNLLNTAKGETRVFELPWPPTLPLEVKNIQYDSEVFDVLVTKHDAQRMTKFAIGLKPGAPYGALQTKVDLEFDSPLFPPTSIVVTGNVLMPLEVSTYTLAAGLLPRDGTQELSFSVYSPYDLPVTIKKLEVVRGSCGDLQSRAVKDAEQEITFALLPPDDLDALVAQSVVRVHAEAGGFTRTFDVEATALIDNGVPET